MIVIPRAWRHVNEWYAHTNHYFWIPCAVCGTAFGGHEVLRRQREHDGSDGLPASIRYRPLDPAGLAWTSTTVCPDCILAGYGQPTPRPFRPAA